MRRKSFTLERRRSFTQKPALKNADSAAAVESDEWDDEEEEDEKKVEAAPLRRLSDKKPTIPRDARRRPSHKPFEAAAAAASPPSMKGGNASPFAAALRAKASKMHVDTGGDVVEASEAPTKAELNKKTSSAVTPPAAPPSSPGIKPATASKPPGIEASPSVVRPPGIEKAAEAPLSQKIGKDADSGKGKLPSPAESEKKLPPWAKRRQELNSVRDAAAVKAPAPVEPVKPPWAKRAQQESEPASPQSPYAPIPSKNDVPVPRSPLAKRRSTRENIEAKLESERATASVIEEEEEEEEEEASLGVPNFANREDLDDAIAEAEENLIAAKRKHKRAKKALTSNRRKAMMRVLRKLRATEKLVNSRSKKASMRECIDALKAKDRAMSQNHSDAQRSVRLAENHLLKLRELKLSSDWKARAKYFERRARQLSRENELKDLKAKEIAKEREQSERALAAVAHLVGDNPDSLLSEKTAAGGASESGASEEDEVSMGDEDGSIAQSYASAEYSLPRSPALDSPFPLRSQAYRGRKLYAHDNAGFGDIIDERHGYGAAAAPQAGLKRKVRDAAMVGKNKIGWRLQMEDNVRRLKAQLAKCKSRESDSERRSKEIQEWVTQLKSSHGSLSNLLQDSSKNQVSSERPEVDADPSTRPLVRIERTEDGQALVQTIDERFFEEGAKRGWHKFSTRDRIDSYYRMQPLEATRDITKSFNHPEVHRRRQKKNQGLSASTSSKRRWK